MSSVKKKKKAAAVDGRVQINSIQFCDILYLGKMFGLSK